MTSKLGAAGNVHDIDVGKTASALERDAEHGRITWPVDWPHLWQAGDNVRVTTTDGLVYPGMVLDVSMVTKSVRIELSFTG